MEYTRQLILVPILHTQADMGSMAQGMEAAYIEQFGRRHWEEYLSLVNDFWSLVRKGLAESGLDWKQVDLYQDGLPVCGKEKEIVAKAAVMGSQNHQLLLDLMKEGATLMGTEDTALLLEEYRSIQAALAAREAAAAQKDARTGRGPDVETRGLRGQGPTAPNGKSRGEVNPMAASASRPTSSSPRPSQEGSEDRLKKRDAFIGGRIGQTLRPPRTGVLFIGMMHHVEQHLPTDVVWTRLAGRG